MGKKYDFSGWATRSNVKCSDGRVIMDDAFIDNDGKTVPLVWNHQHDSVDNVLGNALLENRKGGVYAYCSFNDSESGQLGKMIVQHGDVCALSIFANQLQQQGSNVQHGNIRELSLVLAGANPEAYIESVLSHNEKDGESAIIYCVNNDDILEHADTEDKTKKEDNENSKEKTVKDILDTLTEEQATVVYALLGSILEDDTEKKTDNEGKTTMKHNVFNKENKENTLSHADIVKMFDDAKSHHASLRDTIESYASQSDELKHSIEDATGNDVEYGIANIDYLFPDARNLNTTPDFISRDMEWVGKVMKGAKHVPFSRIKSIHADITMDDARARGYIKGTEKKDEVISLLKRVTNPTTVYKKQKLDRDDMIDITDFDVAAFLKVEMRMMLDEEIARAALIGDGRDVGSEGKIPEENIRPIYKDNDLYAVHKSYDVTDDMTDEDKARAFIKLCKKSRKEYKGSGNPILFTTEDMLTDMLLIEDGNGRVIYETVDKLKTALRVSDIVTVQPLENITREGSGLDTKTYKLEGIIVNMTDYTFGADKGGNVSLFDNFDIDFNQMKYLIETRCSGMLNKPKSALVIESATETVA